MLIEMHNVLNHFVCGIASWIKLLDIIWMDYYSITQYKWSTWMSCLYGCIRCIVWETI